MNIEVAAPTDATTKERGDLLEQLASDFLKTQGYEVDEEVRFTASELFSYDGIVQRCSTVDVIWFNNRLLPNSLFEVEHSTDFQNSLIKLAICRIFTQG